MATTTATRVAAPPPHRPDGAPRKRRRVEPIYYLFLLPALVLFTLAITLPAIMGIFYSFTNSIGFGEWDFVGLINYQAMFTDPAIWQSYLFTFGFAAVTVVVVNVLAFLLAVGLTAKIRMKSGLRAIFVIPMVISGIIIAYVFNYLFSNSVPAAGQFARHQLAQREPARQPRPRVGRHRHRHGVAGDPRHPAHLHRRAAVHPRGRLRGRRPRRRLEDSRPC